MLRSHFFGAADLFEAGVGSLVVAEAFGPVGEVLGEFGEEFPERVGEVAVELAGGFDERGVGGVQVVDELGGGGVVGDGGPCLPSVAECLRGGAQLVGRCEPAFRFGGRVGGGTFGGCGEGRRDVLVHVLEEFAHPLCLALAFSRTPSADGVGEVGRDRAHQVARRLERGAEFGFGGIGYGGGLPLVLQSSLGVFAPSPVEPASAADRAVLVAVVLVQIQRLFEQCGDAG